MAGLNIDKISRVHFIGIGGIGMSALARHFLSEKKHVSGSDHTLTPLTKQLNSEGVQIFGEQTAANITDEIELVIYTEALPKEHAELRAAQAKKIPTINYFTALGRAMNPYYLIAVAGTHGKTTTSAMLTDLFEAAGKDPTAIIGSLRASTQSNYRAGKSKYAIVEACEYRRDFLHLKPDVLVITNIEHDHVDYYADLAAVQSAFRELAEQVHETGVIITNLADEKIAPVISDVSVPVLNYMDYFDLALPLKQPGMHNRLNAAAALTVAKHERLDVPAAKETIMQFAGTWRRFEYKGDYNGAAVYDDYAHHPTEISATLSAARELYPDRELTVAFQPHMYTRTAALFDAFAKALGAADRVLVLPIYAARENNDSGVSSRELAVKTLEFTTQVQYVESIQAAAQLLRDQLHQGQVLVVMGAGDITNLATDLTT